VAAVRHAAQPRDPGFAEALLFPGIQALQNPTVFGWLICASWVPVEAVLLHLFGTTPGKALFRIRLHFGEEPVKGAAFEDLLGRCARVWAFGLGFGLPLIGLITQIVAYRRLTRKGVTSWDESGGFAIRHGPVGWLHWAVAVPLLVVTVILGLALQKFERKNVPVVDTSSNISAQPSSPPVTSRSVFEELGIPAPASPKIFDPFAPTTQPSRETAETWLAGRWVCEYEGGPNKGSAYNVEYRSNFTYSSSNSWDNPDKWEILSDARLAQFPRFLPSTIHLLNWRSPSEFYAFHGQDEIHCMKSVRDLSVLDKYGLRDIVPPKRNNE
jgi:hypothetical protein